MDGRDSRNRTNDEDARVLPEEWGRRLQNGDSHAVQIVRRRVRTILAFKKLGIPHQERQDLEQEIMTAVWQAVNRPGFDFGAGFWGFVETVSSRRCIDWLRSVRELSPVAENLRDEGQNPFERLLSSERTKIVSQVLEALQPQCRKIIAMRLQEGISYKKIAEILGKKEGALRVQLHRCIRSARDIVNRMDPGVLRGAGEDGPDGPS